MSFDDISQFFSPDVTATQTQRYRAFVQIMVDGRDMTSRLNPYLMSVIVKDGGPVSEVDIELDDRDARLDIPPFNAPLQVSIGWTTESFWQVFTGTISDVEHRFGRKQGGRRMHIHGLGSNMASSIKSPMQDHIGEGAGPGQSQGTPVMFADAAKQFAGNVGLTASIGASFAGTGRDHWGMNNESVMQFFSRHASELGAWWRIEGNKVVFNGVNDFNKPTITARWGDNLISWIIKPYAARSTWSGASQQYFEDRTGKWLDIVQKFGLKIPWGGANALFKLPVPAPNAQNAGQLNQSDADRVNWMSGDGRAIINGEPKAAFGGHVLIQGARPGVDGTYLIQSANHSWSRQGYVTILEIYPDIAATANNIGSAGYGPPTAAAAVAVTAPAATITNVTHNTDGSVTTYYSDGTIKTVNSQGTTVLSPNGDESFVPAAPAAPIGESH